MQTHKRKTLAVVGAGPKGIAVAVKAKVLEEIGLPVDDVAGHVRAHSAFRVAGVGFE